MPTSLFKISLTNRYIINLPEANIIAKTFIPQRQIIKYLSKEFISLTLAETANLDHDGQNFNIIEIIRRNDYSFLFGLIRFLNYNCTSNI